MAGSSFIDLAFIGIFPNFTEKNIVQNSKNNKMFIFGCKNLGGVVKNKNGIKIVKLEIETLQFNACYVNEI